MTDGGSDGLGDLHSHLVPGVDDGAESVATALEGLGRMADAGIRRIVTTPHLEGSLTQDPEGFAARMARVDEAWSQIEAAARDAYPDLDFRKGHEVMLDVPDVDFSDARVRLGGTSFVLVEWPRLQVPPQTHSVVSRIRFAGLRPIIAHPERYRGVGDDLAIMGEWRRLGAFLQVSYGSFVGRYGDRARKRAFRLLEAGWADYLSTDFHGRPELELYLDEAREVLEGQGGGEVFSLLAGTNPARLFEDREPLPVPGMELAGGFLKRLKGLFSSA